MTKILNKLFIKINKIKKNLKNFKKLEIIIC